MQNFVNNYLKDIERVENNQSYYDEEDIVININNEKYSQRKINMLLRLFKIQRGDKEEIKISYEKFQIYASFFLNLRCDFSDVEKISGCYGYDYAEEYLNKVLSEEPDFDENETLIEGVRRIYRIYKN
jgi:hypothetical protein